MSDTNIPTTPSVETPTNTTPEVSQLIVSSKPYDDDLLDAYAEEAATESTENVEKAIEPPKEEEKTEEVKTEEDAKDPSRASKGDKVDDGFEDVPIKKLINGKEVEFKVKDAIQAYVKQEEFNRNMDRRITTVAKREQAWAQDQENFKGNLGKIIEVAQAGDFVTAIRGLAKIAVGGSGLDVTTFERQYFEQLDKIHEVYTKLTPEQREAYFAKRALVEAKAKAKELEEEKAAHADKSQLQEKVISLQKQYGLQDEEFWSNYKALESAQVGEGKAFRDTSEIKPEDVVRYSLMVRHEAKVLEAGKKAGIGDEALLNEVSKITAAEPDFTVDDIVRVIETSGLAKNARSEAVENLNRKVEKSKTRFNQASSTKKANGKIEGLDKEDLDFLYRKQPRTYSRPVR